MNIEELKKDYFDGLKYKELQKKYQVTYNQLIYLIQKNQWKRPNNRSKAQKGNKNAKGNRGGHAPPKNKNAVITGAYEEIFFDFLSEEEKKIINKCEIKNQKDVLLSELQTLMIREHRMFIRIKILQEKNKDMTVHSISKTNTQNEHWTSDTVTTNTQIENTTVAIQRIEEALTRVQEAIRRCIDSYHKIENDDRKLELELIRLEKEIAKEGANNPETIRDDSFIKALDDSVESTWDDYEE